MSDAPKAIKMLITITPADPYFGLIAATTERKRAGVMRSMAAVGYAIQNLGGVAQAALDGPQAPAPKKAPARAKVEKQSQPLASMPEPEQNAADAVAEPQSATVAPAVETTAAPTQRQPAPKGKPEVVTPAGRRVKGAGKTFNAQ